MTLQHHLSTLGPLHGECSRNPGPQVSVGRKGDWGPQAKPLKPMGSGTWGWVVVGLFTSMSRRASYKRSSQDSQTV